MSREILVVTPENIEIEYELGGIGTRFLANLIDTLLQSITLICVVIVFGIFLGLLGLASYTPLVMFANFLKGVTSFLLAIAVFIIMWGYYIYFEIAWNGQTPGKRKMGLRVLRDGGYPIGAYSAITRNLLRLIDGIPAAILGGMIVGYATDRTEVVALSAAPMVITLCFLLFTGKYQRMGDFVAGTMVVKQRAPRVPTLEALAPPPRVLPEHLAAYALADIGKRVYEMSVPEYRAVRHANDRRWQLPIAMQQFAAMRLAVPLMRKLEIVPPPGVQRINYADLLEYLAVAFEQYRGVK